MFLIDTENDIADFLEAVNFLPPEGFTVDYFVVPQNEISISNYEDVGFELECEDDLSQTYCRINPIERIDQADSPAEYEDWTVQSPGVRGPKRMPFPRSTDPSELNCPFVKELSESNRTYKDLLLKENFGPFPKGTVFHCVRKNSLKEAYELKNLSQKDANNLSTLGKTSLDSIEYLINVTSQFLKVLTSYKYALEDRIDLSSESLDILTKYSKNALDTQPHNLPGVISSPTSYDINELKTDNERLKTIKTEFEKAKSEADTYKRLLSEDMSIMLKYLKKVHTSNAYFEQMVEVLNSSISNPY